MFPLSLNEFLLEQDVGEGIGVHPNMMIDICSKTVHVIVK